MVLHVVLLESVPEWCDKAVADEMIPAASSWSMSNGVSWERIGIALICMPFPSVASCFYY